MYDRSTHISLLQSLSQGPQSPSWSRFCDQYGELIRGFARRQGVQQVECDDVLQDVLVSLTSAMPNFQYDPARGRFRGYLKTITLHVIYKRRTRGGGRLKPAELDTQVADASRDSSIDDTWEQEWRSHHVRQAMRIIEAEFNELDRQAFHHYAVSGNDPQSTAKAFNMSIDRVYQAKSRITRRLSELIEAQVAEEG